MGQVRPIKADTTVFGTITPWLQLMRPANLFTAAADVLAGFAICGGGVSGVLPWLVLSSLSLYAGGVVLNDVCDAHLDARERPERPIPAGQVSRAAATVQAAVLLFIGVGAGWVAGWMSGLIASSIALLATVYDRWAKHWRALGPVVMGTCRGLNLLLGASAVPALVMERWGLALLPLLYVTAVTTLSRGEVYGGARALGATALGLLASVTGGLAALATVPGIRGGAMVPFLLLFAGMTGAAFGRAWHTPNAASIRSAVQVGVLSLVLLDATLAAAYAGLAYGLIVTTLLPLARAVSRRFAVT